MPIYIASIVIQIALVVHILKTGRNTTWIWVVVMLPIAGSVAYFIIEILPGIAESRSGRKVKRNIGNLVNPDKAIKTAAQEYAIADTVENSMKLAEECLNKCMYNEAKELYQKCLTGMHEHDPYIMLGLAKAEFGLGGYSNVRELLDKLIEYNPDFKDPDAHLLYARSIDEMGDDELAIEEYKVLDDYYPGPEATYRYAALLNRMGRKDDAYRLLDKIIAKSKIAGRHYNSLHKEWVRLAKNRRF